MPCYHPPTVRVFRKSSIPGASDIGWLQEVACGKCLGCRAEQARQWAVRLMHEAAVQPNSWFVTLTYSDRTLPPNGSLAPDDLRRFYRSLRRAYPPGTVRYFGCGEYGDISKRPHYHTVLFGPDFLDLVVLRSGGTSRVWRSPTLEAHWPHGICELGTVTHASAAYVAGYVRKKISAKDNPDAYLRVDPDTGELVTVEKEFSRMSLKPGIGSRWLERYWRDVYPRDFVTLQGKEYKPPRYYDKWMDSEHDPELQEVPCTNCDEHRSLMEGVRERRYEETIQRSKAALAAAEKNHQARVNLFRKRASI